ncbi:MAG: hypothetical protein K6T80_04670 [Firmicutes bacterium]|nr:hypothetical protein [Bacillota bacterium]
MQQQTNPFLQHAVRHGRILLNESGRSVALSRSLISACDEMVSAISSNNVQAAVNAARNARIMADQLAQSTQQVNYTLNERLEMAAYVLNRIQFRLNELAGALQSLRGIPAESFTQMPAQAGPYYQQTGLTPAVM